MITIVAFFTNDGIPELGLSPFVKIWEVATNTLVVAGGSGDVMSEIADGFYKFDFSEDPTKNYIIRCDGGLTVPPSERYVYAGTDIESKDDIADQVWDEATADHSVVGSFGTAMTRMLGLGKENFRILSPVFDGNGNMTSATMKIYPTPADVDANTNAIASYSITATHNAQGEMTDYKVKKL